MLDPKTLLAALTLALAPVVALADDLDDLDVTMEVLDSEAELDVLVSQMRGPAESDAGRESDAAKDRVTESAGATEDSTSPFRENRETDGFERELRGGESDLLHEDDFETDEGEDLELDELPKEDYVDPHY